MPLTHNLRVLGAGGLCRLETPLQATLQGCPLPRAGVGPADSCSLASGKPDGNWRGTERGKRSVFSGEEGRKSEMEITERKRNEIDEKE